MEILSLSIATQSCTCLFDIQHSNLDAIDISVNFYFCIPNIFCTYIEKVFASSYKCFFNIFFKKHTNICFKIFLLKIKNKYKKIISNIEIFKI